MLFTEDILIHSTPNLDVDGACYVSDMMCSFGARSIELQLIHVSNVGLATYACFGCKEKLKKTKEGVLGSLNGCFRYINQKNTLM
jgi:hypothetical protein